MRGPATLIIAALTSTMLAGCTPNDTESPSPQPTTTTTTQPPTPTPSPSPTTQSPTPSASPTEFQSYPAQLPTEDPVSAAIIEGWQEYQRVLRKFSADPLSFTDFTETQYVTTGQKSVEILEQIEGYREQRVKISGDFRYTAFELSTPSDGPDGRQATISYCVDRSGMVVIDYDGVEQDFSHLIPTYPETATLIEGLDEIWRVSHIRNDQSQTC